MRRIAITLLLALATAGAATIAEKTAGMKRLDGYFPMYWDDKGGKLYLEIERFDAGFLYVNSLPAGVGHNDLGLDRGQIGGSRIVKFERSGPKVLLTQPNYGFRATSDNPFERRAVEQAFAQSVLWGFRVEGEDGNRVLVDATDFYLRDAHNIGPRLAAARQGAWRVDANRCAFYLPATKNFPKNTEVEATITLAGDQPGRLVAEVTPNPQALTVRQHHSFIELPGPGYTPRAFDPRAGYFGTTYMDYATPISEPIVKRFITRHRLKPGGTITYYLDRGAPEPVRSALLEGARWWSQAFASAGFPNGFRVELLPEDADPMDVRYNLIQWIHRSTRGWSYGATIADPRTGEIIKGQVSLGSLRTRQDFLIAEGLLAPYESGKALPPELERMVLARVRQLAAHEVGHTLGLSHNFAASVHNRASVMDYPHPWITLPAEGTPDLKDAYSVGIGEWDKVAIRYGYTVFPEAAGERQALDQILRTSQAAGLVFLSDEDSRPEGSASPIAHLWDSGPNAVDELNRLLEVRRRSLQRFGERNIRESAPMSTLEDVLVPLYLLHRYQTEAAAKVLGGADYRFALRGDGQKIVEMVPAAEQRRALDALLKTIRPDTLVIPEQVLKLIPPPAHGYHRTQEDFPRHTGLTFDPLGAAESAANLSVRLILNPERAARLVEFHAREAQVDGLGEVIDKLVAATWKAPAGTGLAGEVQHVVDGVVLYHLMTLANTESAPTQVRAIAYEKLESLRRALAQPDSSSAARGAHWLYAAAQIKRFEDNPKEFPVAKPAEPPPGQPIGCDWQ